MQKMKLKNHTSAERNKKKKDEMKKMYIFILEKKISSYGFHHRHWRTFKKLLRLWKQNVGSHFKIVHFFFFFAFFAFCSLTHSSIWCEWEKAKPKSTGERLVQHFSLLLAFQQLKTTLSLFSCFFVFFPLHFSILCAFLISFLIQLFIQ